MGYLSIAKFVCFNDSSFGNLSDGGSQGGENRNSPPLMWQLKKLCTVVKSTIAVETLPQVEATEVCFLLIKYAK